MAVGAFSPLSRKSEGDCLIGLNNTSVKKNGQFTCENRELATAIAR